jgi:uncharacterized protein YggE
VGEVVKVQEEISQPAPVRPLYPQMAMAKGARESDIAEPHVESRKQEVSASVQVVFRIR